MEVARRATRSGVGHPTRRAAAYLIAVILAVSSMVAAPVAHVLPAEEARAAGTFADPYFREYAVFTGLSSPVTVRFAGDGRAFVGEKSGRVKAFDSVTDTTATTVIDLRTDVNSYWDRGMLGIALDPDFLAGRPYLYVFYVYDGWAGDPTAPAWADTCPAPPSGPGGTLDGCPVTSRLDRYTINLSTNVAVAGSRVPLLDGFCQQFGSHAGGGLAFGPDGELYLAAGDGASFTTTDYGQRGGTVPDPADPLVPANPCGDPVTFTNPPGTTPAANVATAEGGALRSQDIRTTGDPAGLAGSLLRIDPDTGAASAGNPLAAQADANARRIVAHGFRNPFRMTFRPGTSDLYVAEVGNSTWEAIERVAIPTSPRTPTTLPNFGWPCYEGPGKTATWEGLGNNLCDALYAVPSAVTFPLYTYSHVSTKSPTGPCFPPDAVGRVDSSVTGVAFYTGPTGGAEPYPTAYNGALFFADYSRDCLGVIPTGTNGLPDPGQARELASGVGNPVDLVRGPGGDLYYVDIIGGRVVRIRYLQAPTARATATPDQGAAPMAVRLDGRASTSNDSGFPTLSAYNWDLDDDGAYDDATGSVHEWSITERGVYPVGLEVVGGNGLRDTVGLVVDAANDAPVPSISTPGATLKWAVGDTITFSGSATDAQDGTVPASRLSWDVVMLHCPGSCHEHTIESFDGVASGSFSAPDHEYPSRLELRLTATDELGVSGRTAVQLMPKTTTIAVSSTPAGVPVSVGGDPVTSPSSTTVLLGGVTSVSPPLTTTIGGARYRFSTWADGRTRVRDVTADGPVSLTATYVPDAPDTCSTSTTLGSGTWRSDRPSGNGDIDWFRFSLTSTRRVVVTLGNLPVDARLDLYAGCSTLLASANSAGTRFEEITRSLGAGTYRVRVSMPGNAWSASPYSVRFRAFSAGFVVKSARATLGSGGGGPVRIVGEVLNNTGSTRGQVTVRATFRNASGTTVQTLSTTAFARRLGNGEVTPFVLVGSVPPFTSVSYAMTSGSVPTPRSLTVGSVTGTANPDGTITERGTVRNAGTTTASSVAVARTWYGKLGELLDRGAVSVSPSTLAPGASGTFTILRPALPTAQAARTQLRAR